MSDSYSNAQVEMMAVYETKRSIVRHAHLIPAMPDVDLNGVDLLAFGAAPFRAYPVQVKGTTGGFKVWAQYAEQPTIITYVLNPVGDTPELFVLTGTEAWALPEIYVEQGGKASDYVADKLNHYRFPRVTVLLRSILEERYADTEENWTRVLAEIDEQSGGFAHLGA